MKTRVHFLCLLMSCLAVARVATAQGTAFTYQGVLSQNGGAVNGSNDLTFTLYNAASGTTTVGTSNVVNDSVMTNGLFTVTLDFGAGTFDGTPRWLQIAARPGASAGAYTNLVPRTPITPTPYAMFANAASNLSGLLPAAALSGTYGSAVNFSNGANQFSGIGSNLTALNASEVTLGAVPAAALRNAWRLIGNSNTTPGTHFLGTTDNQPLEFRVNSQRGLRLEARVSINSGLGINLIGGSAGNYVTNGVIGATVFGGGAAISTNQVLADFGTVVGGSRNTASEVYATVAGGNLNTASGVAAAVGGGQVNVAGGLRSTVGGGAFNSAPANYATIPGGADNRAAGDYSFAAGRQAKANHGGTFVWADSTAADFASTASNQFLIRASGGVGIGTINPATTLDVRSGTPEITIGTTANTGGALNFGNAGHGVKRGYSQLNDVGLYTTAADLYLSANGTATSQFVLKNSGNVGIGTNSPAERLQVEGNIRASGTVSVNDASGTVKASMAVDVNGKGKMTCDYIQVNGGADIAEPFEVRGAPMIEPGMIVAIDPDRPGQLRLCNRAYDSTVAGIISGANGIQPGLMLQQSGTMATGRHPVALTGRVWCHADADAAGEIVPGDLLTSATEPGHAMKAVDRNRAFGAIIGKAMTPLAKGKGLVLVLVSLQ
ncbi:MAG: hypothetical protein V9H26_05015 [Verrucomicrobiota bacterium]